MKKYITIGAALLVLGILGLEVVAFAQGGMGMNRQMGTNMGAQSGGGAGMRGMMGGMRGGMRGGRGMMGMQARGAGAGGMMAEAGIQAYIRNATALGLSEDQVKKLRDRQSAFQKEGIDLRAKIEIGRIELRELLAQDTVNMAAVEKKVRANQDLTATLTLSSIKANQDAKNILTPDQRKKAEELRATGMQRRMNAPGAPMRGGRGQQQSAPVQPQGR